MADGGLDLVDRQDMIDYYHKWRLVVANAWNEQGRIVPAKVRLTKYQSILILSLDFLIRFTDTSVKGTTGNP